MAENQRVRIEDPLADILSKNGIESIFNQYREREDVGTEIFKQLCTRFNAKHHGFQLTDTQNDIGLLSQCQSLQSLMLLAGDFKIGFDVETPTKVKNADGEIMDVRDMMDEVIKDIIDRVIRVDENDNNKTVYVFDASPYDTDNFSPEYSNIDAMTWVVSTFLLVLKYHAEINERCKFEGPICKIITYALKYIVDAYIDPSSEEDGVVNSNKLQIGWNFTKKCQEPSLYYSFAVCEVYLDIFNAFESYRQFLDDKADKEGNVYSPLINTEKFNARQSEWDTLVKEYGEFDAEIDEDAIVGKATIDFPTEFELARLYHKICITGAGKFDEKTGAEYKIDLYVELEKKCKALANKIWDFVQDEFDSKFFYNDLSKTITDEDIKMSTTSDALFNTVYIINILIDSGLDQDFEKDRDLALKKLEMIDNGAIVDDDKEHRQYVEDSEIFNRKYNELLEVCQLAIQKAFRTYETLKNNGKDYIVDQFLIGFNENFTTHASMIRELRKKRMRVFSLVPLLIHTNFTISEYLVKYPQVSIKKYLGYILDNRYVDNKKNKVWIWESDGYFSASNYYFIQALSEFYSYHEKYEKQFIDIGDKNEKHDKGLIKDTEESITKEKITPLEQKVNKLTAELNEKKEEIERIKKEISPVETEIKVLMEGVLQEKFAGYFVDMLNSVAKGLTVNDIDSTKATEEDEAIREAISNLIIAILSNKIYGLKPNNCKSEKEYKDLVEALKKDVEDIIDMQINSARHSTDKVSDLRKLLQSK